MKSIDHSDKIENFLDTIKPILKEMKNGCMVATQEASVHIYKSGKEH
ncbi:MAG: hypothetical protein ACQEQ0_09300 [Bacteroidota bacterium]